MAKPVNGNRLSARQLAVASVVGGLSPAAAWAGTASWIWVFLWSGVGVLVAVLVLMLVKRKAPQKQSRLMRAVYGGWAVVLASRVLTGVVDRLEQTSGGSPRFWLLAIVAVPLLLMGWGRSVPFFRMVEILWLASVVILTLALVPGVFEIELRYLFRGAGDWRTAALAVGWIFVPALYVLPYIYNVDDGASGSSAGWLAVLGGIAATMCLVTTGVLGAGGEVVPQAFFAAVGAAGGSARIEGLLSVIWLLPDLVFVGLLCRSWGERRWPAAAALVSVGISYLEILNRFSPLFFALGSAALLVLALITVCTGWNFVVKKSG